MPEPSTHINYSFEDIQRYLQGKMSAAEMHNIEKAALQDPFLADAIEGYTDITAATAQQHLTEINAALLSKNKPSKIVAFNSKTKWLRIAAMVILLAGVGVTGTYFFKTTNKPQQVAHVKKVPAGKGNVTPDSAVAAKPETPAQNGNEIATVTEKNKQPNISLSKKEKRSQSRIYADTITSNEADKVTVMAAPAEQGNETTKSFAPLSNQKNYDSVNDYLKGGVNSSANTFAGKVIDENKKPVAGVVIEAGDKQKAAVTDLNGNFVLQNGDSILNVTTTTVGYENKNALLKSSEANLITLQQNRAGLNDVVVTGYGAKKNKSKTQTATPVGGWTNFNSYVVSQLKQDSAKNENYISANDVVELEFLIDDEGNPYNIQITKPLDDKKNSKAIDILKSGPKWTNTSKNKKGKVAIAF